MKVLNILLFSMILLTACMNTEKESAKQSGEAAYSIAEESKSVTEESDLITEDSFAKEPGAHSEEYYSIVEEYYSADLSSVELEDGEVAVSVGANIPQVDLEGIVGEKVNNHLKAAADEFLHPLASQYPPEFENATGEVYDYQLQYEIGINNKSLLSVRYYGSVTSRVYHVSHTIYSVNFDMRTGDLVRLNDIYTINTDFGMAVAKHKELCMGYISQIDHFLELKPAKSDEEFADFIAEFCINMDTKTDYEGNFSYRGKTFSYLDSKYLYIYVLNTMERIPLDVLEPYLKEDYSDLG